MMPGCCGCCAGGGAMIMPGDGAPNEGAVPGVAGLMVMFCGAPVYGLTVMKGGCTLVPGFWNMPGCPPFC